MKNCTRLMYGGLAVYVLASLLALWEVMG